MIYFLRNSVKNFIVTHQDMSLNGLPLTLCPIVEDIETAKTLETYIENILMCENQDA